MSWVLINFKIIIRFLHSAINFSNTISSQTYFLIKRNIFASDTHIFYSLKIQIKPLNLITSFQTENTRGVV